MLHYIQHEHYIQFELVEKSHSYKHITDGNLVDNLTQHPVQYLTQSIDDLKMMTQIQPNTPIFTTKQIDECLLSHPLSLFTECVDLYCSLNRIKRPQLRKSFERQFEQSLGQLMISDNDHVVYTSFGSGYLFQDVVNLCYLLKCGFSHIDLNLIDEQIHKWFYIMICKFCHDLIFFV